MSFVETLVILLVAVIVFGPKRLPEVARKVGKVMGALRRAGDEFKHQLMTMDQQVTTSIQGDLDQLVPTDEEVALPSEAFDFGAPPTASLYEPNGSLMDNLDAETRASLEQIEVRKRAEAEKAAALAEAPSEPTEVAHG